MTCIVAITDGQNVVLGGDSAAVGGNELRVRADSKVFQVGSYAIGFTSSFRMGQILRYETTFPEPDPGIRPEELERFFISEVIPPIRQAFSDHGFAKTVRRAPFGEPSISEEGQSVGGTFLVGVAGQIFEVRQDFSLARLVEPYSAVGAAAPYALGAFHALEPLPDFDLKTRAGKALAAAEANSPYVREPFRFVELRSAV